jgi:hypothetical protein
MKPMVYIKYILVKFDMVYSSAVQRSYVLGHNSVMPMEVRAPPHHYYYYYYYYYYY